MRNIANAKAVMEWQASNQRAACWNCKHVAPAGPGVFGDQWNCKKGGFFTSRFAICKEHKRAPGDPRK